MTTYSTGNPIGSTDPRDLSDNSENFDNAVNNTASTNWTDRFGVSRVSLAGQVGYVGTGAGGAIEIYAAGLVMGTYNTIILYSGEFYRPSASATLPYTTTATLPDVDSNLASVGDAVLRQDLASSPFAGGGALLVTGVVQRVTSRTEMKTYDVPADYQFSLNEGGRSGLFVVKSGTPPADPQEGVYVVLTNGEYVERLYSGPLNSEFFGAAPGGTDAANRTAVQAAIALIDLLGGGTVLNPSGIRFGVLNNDATTYPDFSAASTDIIVEDHGPADANIGGDKAGSQLRYFQYTEQTSPVGQHNGNGIRTTGDWAPYFWADNTEVLAAQGDPSRTATDNRRASIFFATRGVANWRIGQGNTSGDFTESELTAFLIAVNGLPDLGVSGLTTMLSFLKTNGNFGINTGAPNASVHIASRAGQSPVFRLDGSPSTGNLRLILDQDVTTSEIQVTPTDTRLLVGGSTVLQAFTNGNVLTTKGISGGSFTTTQRNALGSLQGGTMVFDSTLGIPIWKPSTGTGTWVNASGTSV
jgi:hypothetical protein